LGFNHRQIQRIILPLEKLEEAILFVDFTKAFDLLECAFILTTFRTLWV